MVWEPFKWLIRKEGINYTMRRKGGGIEDEKIDERHLSLRGEKWDGIIIPSYSICKRFFFPHKAHIFYQRLNTLYKIRGIHKYD